MGRMDPPSIRLDRILPPGQRKDLTSQVGSPKPAPSAKFAIPLKAWIVSLYRKLRGKQTRATEGESRCASWVNVRLTLLNQHQPLIASTRTRRLRSVKYNVLGR